MQREAWIIDTARSPRGTGKPGKGGLAHLHPQRVLAQVLDALRQRVGFEPADVEDVVTGNGAHAGDHAHDIGRMAVLDAGWPITVPGVTLNRFCGSGQQVENRHPDRDAVVDLLPNERPRAVGYVSGDLGSAVHRPWVQHNALRTALRQDALRHAVLLAVLV